MQLGPGGIWLQGQVSGGPGFSQRQGTACSLSPVKIRSKGAVPQPPPHPPGWGRVRCAPGTSSPFSLGAGPPGSRVTGSEGGPGLQDGRPLGSRVEDARGRRWTQSWPPHGSSESRAQAGFSGVGTEVSRRQLLVAVVFHQLPGHLGQHTLGQSRGGRLGVGTTCLQPASRPLVPLSHLRTPSPLP